MNGCQEGVGFMSLRSVEEILRLMEECLWLNDGSYELLLAELEDHPDYDG